jgi:hypothetical protein
MESFSRWFVLRASGIGRRVIRRQTNRLVAGVVTNVKRISLRRWPDVSDGHERSSHRIA